MFGIPTAIYFNFAFVVWYLDLALAAYFVLAELQTKLTLREKLKLTTIFLLFMAIPVNQKSSPNTLTHWNVAEGLVKSPMNPEYCRVFVDGQCTETSSIVWSYVYHIASAPFTLLGQYGTKIFNSLCMTLFFTFIYLTLRESGRPLPTIFAFSIVPVISFLNTAILGYFSLALGGAMLYFFHSLTERGQGLAALIATSAAYLHARPENFIYVALLLPSFLKELEGKPKLQAFGATNVLLKAAEYLRGGGGLGEGVWALDLGGRLQALRELGKHNLAQLFSFDFNLGLSLLMLIGTAQLARKKRATALLPLVSFVVYTSKWGGGSLQLNPRFLINFLVTFAPAVMEAVRNIKVPMPLMALCLVPLLFVNFNYQTRTQRVYNTALKNKEAIVSISNNYSMPVYSYLPGEFRAADSVWALDDFPYPPGSYLAVMPLYNAKWVSWHNNCTLAPLEQIDDIMLYNMTCPAAR